VFKGSKDTVPLDASEELIAGDLLNASQELAPEPESPRSTDGPQVQISVAQFDAAQVLTHLYQCSRGFFLGGIRPGTHVQILQGGSVIGTGDAIDGTAAISIPAGLPAPAAGAPLTARQLICPKPPPPPPSSGYLADSPLPPIALFPYHSGQTLPAPTILQGLTACSRSVQVTGIQPGSDVFLEATNGAWWASLGPSDQISAWLTLPVQLREGEEVSIRQEVSIRCEVKFERKITKVGPKQVLAKPGLAQIDCNTTPSIYAVGVKPEADVEFSVFFGGVETKYRTVATESYGPLPAPPMPAGASVKIRQGECDVWSDWSDPPQTANPLTTPPLQPKISGELFSCQDVVPVENVFPLNGYLQVLSKKHGELNRVPVGSNTPVISIAPSLSAPDDVWIEHHVCGYTSRSEAKAVHQRSDVVAGTIKEPLFDGDTQVILTHAVEGARVELWEETKTQLLQAGRAPFGKTEFVDVIFSSFGPLHAGWNIFAKTLHCGNFVQTHPSVSVVFKPPVIGSIVPSTRIVGQPGFTLTVKGSNFLSGAKVQWNGADRPTTFVSAAELHATITAADVATVKTVSVRVVNPDGQVSGTLNFAVAANPPPVVGFDEMLIQNCNTNTLPSSTIHRPIHIYFRRTDLGPPGPWIPINDSPHDADYDSGGHCPANSSVGARFSLDDGGDYEVVCTDPLLAGCITGGPDEPACRRSPVFTIHGKTGGGVKTVIVN
jgi:IPT/TIG domain